MKNTCMKSSKIIGFALVVLGLISFVLWNAAITEDRHGILTVSFLDVGQGDSVFIDAPSGRQVLIDGGPDTSVLRRLSAVVPWYDRTIDVVIPTHPDADHVAGLIDVLARYRVSYVIQSSVLGDTATWKALEKSVAKEGSINSIAHRGQIIVLGKGAYLEVLSPDRLVPNLETNTACVVMRLIYGNTSFMLPCDAPQAMEKYLVQLDGENLKSTVLKPGHHGSKTSSSALFLGYVDPEIAVYSRGCDNKYGHPNKETIAIFALFGIPTLDTCTEGTVTFVSDGKKVWRK